MNLLPSAVHLSSTNDSGAPQIYCLALFANSTKGSITAVEVANSIHADFVAADVRGMTKMDASSGFNSSLLSQALPPIGTPPLKIDAQPDLRSQMSR